MSCPALYPTFIIALLCSAIYSSAQEEEAVGKSTEKYQVLFQLSPTLERLNMRSSDSTMKDLHGSKLSYNFGIDYKHFLSPSTTFETGVLFQNKGLRNVLGNALDGRGLFDKRVLALGLWYISVPTNFNFHIRTSRKSRILITTGLMNGILINQMQEGRRTEAGDKSPFTGGDITDSKVKINIFRRHYMGLNLGFSFMKYIKSKLVLEIEPMYTRGINKALRKDAPVSYGGVLPEPTPKLDSFSINFRLGYFFNKQIKNYQKDF